MLVISTESYCDARIHEYLKKKTKLFYHKIRFRAFEILDLLMELPQVINKTDNLRTNIEGGSRNQCYLKTQHSLTHSLPGATTHAGFWPTQEVASNHLYPWP